MVCIYCDGKTKVINSRNQKRLNQKWRRRECELCGAVLTSTEQINTVTAIQVKDSANRYKPFLRDKLFLSIHDSLKHRKTALDDAIALTDTIVSKLVRNNQSAIIEKSQISQIVTPILKRFDKVAATHYQAFHLI